MDKKLVTTEFGTELLIERIKGVNVVSIFFAVKTGSANEREGIEGVSHFLEHMLFKGGDKYSATEITEYIEKGGGEINAYTSLDETVYYTNILKENWEQGFDILASMVLKPKFNEEDFENERKVILEEMRGGRDNPYKVLIDETFKASFPNDSYSNPIIGFEKSLKNLSVNDLKNYYEQFYLLDNILIVIVGDLDISETVRKVNLLIKPYCQRGIRREKINEDFNNKITFKTPETKLIAEKVNQHYLNITFRFPGGYFKEFAETYILCSLLGEFKNSPLKETLKENLKIVTDISTYFYLCKRHSLLIINSIFPLSQSPENVIYNILNVVNDFKLNNIDFHQIYKAVINHKADIVYNRESVASEGKNLVFYHIITGNYLNEEKFLRQIDKTDAKKIKFTANKYLKNPVITLITPNSELSEIPKNKKKTKMKLRNKTKRLVRLDNGIRVIMEKNSRLPIITFNIISLGGLKYEDDATNGLTYLMGNLLTKGSLNYSKKEINEKFEFYSGAIESFGARNSFGVQGLVLDEFFIESFKIIKDSFFNPLFLGKEIEREKKYIIEKIIAENDEPSTLVMKKFYESVFEGSYYKRPVKGTVENMKGFSREAVLNHHRSLVKSENVVFGITGNLKDNISDYVLSELSSVKREEFLSDLTPLKLKERSFTFREKIEKNQTHIICGFPAPPVSHEDAVKMKIIANLLGNHSGKLFLRLREDLGLCYSTTAFYIDAPEAGAFGIYAATSPEKEELTLEKIKDIIRELKNGSVSEEELGKTKNYIKGRRENFRQKFLNTNTRNVYNILYELGIDYEKKYDKMLEQVKVKDISEAAEKYFDFRKIVYTIFTPEGA